MPTLPPSRLVRKALPYRLKAAESYFASCKRDEEGHCKPSGEVEAAPKEERQVIGRGSTGEVIRVGNTVRKKASNSEGKIYEKLSGVPGIAAGKQEGGEIVTPYFKHVASVDTIPEKQRKSYAPVIRKNLERLVNGLTALSQLGADYNDPLQVGFDEQKQANIFDFSAASLSDSAVVDNLQHLGGYLKQFGLEGDAAGMARVSTLWNYVADESVRAFDSDSDEGKDAEKIASRLDGQEPKYAYYSYNAREIPGMAQSEPRDRIKAIFATEPLSDEFMKQWEIHPAVHRTKQESGSKSLETYPAKAGFTGKKEDKLGREHCYTDGKQTPCSPDDQPKPDQTAKQEESTGPDAKLTDDPSDQQAQEQGEHRQRELSELTPDERQQFDQEWDAAVTQALGESDVSAHEFTPEEVAAEQNWHGQYMQWRFGTPGILPPEEAGKAVRFATGLTNGAVGTPEHVNQLAGQVQAEPGLVVEIVDLLKRFFELLPELLDPTAKVLAGTFGEQAGAVVQAASKKTQLGGKPKVTQLASSNIPKQTQLSPQTLKEKKKQEDAAANARRYMEAESPSAEQVASRGAPVAHEGEPAVKKSTEEIRKGRALLKKQAQGKQKKRDAMTDEQRAEADKVAAENKVVNDAKDKETGERIQATIEKQNARLEQLGDAVTKEERDKWPRMTPKARQQFLKKKEQQAKGKKSLQLIYARKDLSWLDSSRGGALVPPPARLPPSRLPPSRLSKSLVYARKQWVTVGGGKCPDGEGQHCGGTPMDIGKDGKVKKGPAALKGRKLPKSRLRKKDPPARKQDGKPAKQPSEAELEQMLAEAPSSAGPKPKPEKPEKPAAKPEKPKTETKPAAKPAAKPAEPANKGEDTPLKGKKPKLVKVSSDGLSPKQREQLLKDTLGMVPDNDTLGAMVNATDGSKLEVSKGYSPGEVKVRNYNKKDGITSMRTFGQHDGKRYVHNDLFIIDNDSPYKGKGVEFFRDQAAALKEAGLDYIETHAAGSKKDSNYNGYYTWPRMGYDGTMSQYAIARLPKELQQQLSSKTNVQALFALPGGKEAWKEHGDDIMDAKFDLSDGSESFKILEAYLKERADRGKRGTDRGTAPGTA